MLKMFAVQMCETERRHKLILFNQMLKKWKHNKGDQHERQPATKRLIYTLFGSIYPATLCVSTRFPCNDDHACVTAEVHAYTRPAYLMIAVMTSMAREAEQTKGSQAWSGAAVTISTSQPARWWVWSQTAECASTVNICGSTQQVVETQWRHLVWCYRYRRIIQM